MFDSTIFSSQNIGVYTVATIVAVITIVTIYGFVTSKNWETTSGKIEHIEMLEIHNRPVLDMSSGKPYTEYKIDLKYRYNIKGKPYTGSKIYPLIPNVFSNKIDAEGILKQFNEGQETAIYFNPKDPGTSCLISSAGISNIKLYTFVLIALVLISITTTGIIYFNKIFSD